MNPILVSNVMIMFMIVKLVPRVTEDLNRQCPKWSNSFWFGLKWFDQDKWFDHRISSQAFKCDIVILIHYCIVEGPAHCIGTGMFCSTNANYREFINVHASNLFSRKYS